MLFFFEMTLNARQAERDALFVASRHTLYIVAPATLTTNARLSVQPAVAAIGGNSGFARHQDAYLISYSFE